MMAYIRSFASLSCLRYDYLFTRTQALKNSMSFINNSKHELYFLYRTHFPLIIERTFSSLKAGQPDASKFSVSTTPIPNTHSSLMHFSNKNNISIKRVLSSELFENLNQKVILRGWLNNLRPIGKFINFLILRDGAGISQIVINDKKEFQKVVSLKPGSILCVEGTVIASAEAGLGVELINPTIEVEVPIYCSPPIEYNKAEMNCDLDFILDHRPISLRNQKIQAVFRIQAEIVHAYRLYMHDIVKAVEYFSPNIIWGTSEGGTEFFNVDYYGYSASLAQSSQLYKQIMVSVNERVFSLAPFFRAENSHTKRHLTEGKQLEFEMAFFNHWEDILDVQEQFIKFVVQYLQKNCEKEINMLGNKIIRAPEHIRFPRLTFKEAGELYFKRTGIDERTETDLSPSAEKNLCDYALEVHGTDLIFITDWKTTKRPFYAFPKENDPDLTNTFDLLCAGTEITSGGQRRHVYSSLIEGMLAKKLNPVHFEDYLSVFKYGMPPHGGFGMGLERLTMTLLQLDNVREASLFPSDPKRIASNRIRAKVFYGGENIRGEIINLLRKREVYFKHFFHENAKTSMNLEQVTDNKLKINIKSLILNGKNSKKNYLVVIPNHLNLDIKLISLLIGESCEFENPQVVKDKFGLTTGGISPFGSLINLETFFDVKIKELEEVTFNCGLSTDLIVMNSKDLIAMIQPHFLPLAKV